MTLNDRIINERLQAQAEKKDRAGVGRYLISFFMLGLIGLLIQVLTADHGWRGVKINGAILAAIWAIVIIAVAAAPAEESQPATRQPAQNISASTKAVGWSALDERDFLYACEENGEPACECILEVTKRHFRTVEDYLDADIGAGEADDLIDDMSNECDWP